MIRGNEHPDLIKYYSEVYEEIAETYHNDRFGDLRGKYDLFETWKATTELYNELDLDLKTANALDVGCGTGKLSLPLAAEGADVNCLDMAMGMLKQCRHYAEKKNVHGNIHLISASAFMLPYRANTFDVVVASRFLHLFPLSNYPALIREMLRVVKPDGYLVIEIKNNNYGFIVSRWRDYMKARITGDKSSSMSLRQIYRFQKNLTDGHIVKVKTCQLPKGHLFPLEGMFSSALRALSRSLLRPIAGFYFVAIKKT